MEKLERQIKNASDSYNPESGKHYEHERHIDKLLNEYTVLESNRMLLIDSEDIEYGDIDPDENGVIMTTREFKSLCGENSISDDDGIAFYVHNDTRLKEALNIYLRPTAALSNLIRKDFTEVIWYKTSNLEFDNQVTNYQFFEDIEEDF